MAGPIINPKAIHVFDCPYRNGNEIRSGWDQLKKGKKVPTDKKGLDAIREYAKTIGEGEILQRLRTISDTQPRKKRDRKSYFYVMLNHERKRKKNKNHRKDVE